MQKPILKSDDGERIAKIIARSGICSRRDAEKLIFDGRVSYKGRTITNPATKFKSIDDISVDNIPLKKTTSKLWIYHKPVGLVVSHADEQGRETVFDRIPISERVISVGRLDKNTSGLLLLTNDGELARALELPQNNFHRTYLVRVYGKLNFNFLKESLRKGITINGIKYKPIKVELDRRSDNNTWLKLTITEGKNREIRNILQHFDLKISKLIRIKYGPFSLDSLELQNFYEIYNWKDLIESYYKMHESSGS